MDGEGVPSARKVNKKIYDGLEEELASLYYHRFIHYSQTIVIVVLRSFVFCCYGS